MDLDLQIMPGQLSPVSRISSKILQAPNLDYLADCTQIYSPARPGMAGSESWGSPLKPRPWSRRAVPPLSSGRTFSPSRELDWWGFGVGPPLDYLAFLVLFSLYDWRVVFLCDRICSWEGPGDLESIALALETGVLE